jgi:DNA-binding response OmpR family regulator
MRILVVEDQEKIARAIKKGLEHESFAVDAVFDGEAARHKLLSTHPYDLVILDVMLPLVSGFQICKEMRSSGDATPILMLTALDSVESKVGGLDMGADDYLPKPFAFEELLARVRALLRRPKETVKDSLAHSGILLDIQNHTVTKKGKKVPLTLKEFAILEFLMRHPNQVLSREQIMNHVWDQAFDSFSNVVDVHIKNLRKKLQKSNETIFEAIHGVGYKFKS